MKRKEDEEEKFCSGRRVSCSRRWSLASARTHEYLCSCTFSISIVQSRCDIRSRPTLSSNCDYEGDFNEVSFPRIFPTEKHLRRYALKMRTSERFWKRANDNSRKALGESKTTLSDCTIPRNTNSVNAQSRLLSVREIFDNKISF